MSKQFCWKLSLHYPFLSILPPLHSLKSNHRILRRSNQLRYKILLFSWIRHDSISSTDSPAQQPTRKPRRQILLFSWIQATHQFNILPLRSTVPYPAKSVPLYLLLRHSYSAESRTTQSILLFNGGKSHYSSVCGGCRHFLFRVLNLTPNRNLVFPQVYSSTNYRQWWA